MRKENVTGNTVEKIRDYVFKEKKMKEGQRLPGENSLSEILGVSRSTLREAIKVLEGQGILKVSRGKGTFVASEVPVKAYEFVQLAEVEKELKDLYEARLIFEPEMAAFACERATEKEIQEIVRIQKLLDAAIENGEEHIELAQLFHHAIVMAAHNEFLLQLLPVIDDAIEEAMHVYDRVADLDYYSIHDHRIILDFICKRDAVGAKHAMSIHLRHGMNALSLNRSSIKK